MTDRSVAAGLALARVLAHCADDPAAALGQLAGAVAADPADPEPYALLAELRAERPAELGALLARANTLSTVLARSYFCFLDGELDEAVLALGAVAGARPAVAWAAAPWFGDPRVAALVDPEALAEAALRIGDHGHPLDVPAVAEALAPWVAAVEAVAGRAPQPETVARYALFLRMCGLPERSFALCDRADALAPAMLTEVVRAGTWRERGDLDRAADAFERALLLDPANWSLHLDLADLDAVRGDFASAAARTARGLELEPAEPTLRAAHAAYRFRLAPSAPALRELLDAAGALPPSPYRRQLLDLARATDATDPLADLPTDLPADLLAEADRLRDGN
ncbi:tetratricopeptide repeat protein [Kitasatospora sp. NPDC057198]|uniref:tetratricopeptide repeat protein n=1 Tax=Kitasatospora sp. NPDC057198 TaxID=3346046 RepID=UPI003625F7AE